MQDNRFYVYGHFTTKDDVLFYVGKGTAGRHLSRSGRSAKWNAITSADAWYSKILQDGLSSEEALTNEFELIKSTIGLVNHQRKSIKCGLTFEGVDSVFMLNAESCTGLSFKNSPLTPVGVINRMRSASYYSVMFRGKRYLAHRVVWLLKNKSLSRDKVIDHIDGNSLNNDVSNLREVSIKTNNENKKISKSNKTGVTGVSLRSLNGSNYYASNYMLNGKIKTKAFSTKKYGLLPAFAMAVLYRWKGINEINANGGDYTNRNGTHRTVNLDESVLRDFSDIRGVVTGIRNGYSYYSSSYVLNQKTISRTFNISKHGLLPSLAKAIAFRRAGLLKIKEQR